jgi:adenylyl cyclase-associated protein
MAVAKLEALIGRLEVASAKVALGGCGGAGGGGDDETEEYPQVLAYDSTFGPHIKTFQDAAKAIDPELAEMSEFIVKAFKEVRRLVLGGARNNKPDDINVVLKPLTDINAGFADFDKKHFKTKFVNQLKAVHEALTVFNWVTVGPSAGSFVGEMTGAVQCYTNKILMEFRGKDENQVKWVNGICGAFKVLPEYINDYHKNGLSWNARAPKATGPAKLKDEAGGPPAAAAPAAAAPAAAKPAPAAAAKPALNIPVKAAAAKTAAVK